MILKVAIGTILYTAVVVKPTCVWTQCCRSFVKHYSMFLELCVYLSNVAGDL
jgi:hypothetical protein